MYIRFVLYFLYIRHAELVSASHSFDTKQFLLVRP